MCADDMTPEEHKAYIDADCDEDVRDSFHPEVQMSYAGQEGE